MKVSRDVMTAVALAALVAVAARPAHAQELEPAVHFGMSAGLNIPLGTLSQNNQVGYSLTGMGQGTPAGWPVAIRGELSYASFSGKHGYVAQSVTSVNADAVLPILHSSGDTPYLIGGVGFHHTSAFAGLQTENDLGINFGGGWKWQLAGMSTYAEIRFVHIAHSGTAWEMMPLTFGVLF